MQVIDIALDRGGGEGRGCCLSQSHDLVYSKSDDRRCRQLATRVDGQQRLGFVCPCKDRVTGGVLKQGLGGCSPTEVIVLRITVGGCSHQQTTN